MPVKQVRKETLRVPIELSHASLHDFDEAVDSALRSGITELRRDFFSGDALDESPIKQGGANFHQGPL